MSTIPSVAIRLPVLVAVLTTAAVARAEIVNFTIDPDRSSLTTDAILVVFGDAQLVAQDEPAATSLTTQYQGTIQVDVNDLLNPTTLQILEAEAEALDSGAWLPAAGGGMEGVAGDPAPANYGYLLDAGAQGTGFFALRDTAFTIMSDPLNDFGGGGFVPLLALEVLRGSYEFNAVTVIGNAAGADDIAGEQAMNDALALITYEVTGDIATLTVPVEALFGEGDDIEVTFIGELVATANFGPSLAGDYNDNGQVEQSDLDLVLLNWGEDASTLPPAWTNQRPTQGIVDQEELDGVLLNWGNETPALAAAESVPEPHAFLLLLLAPTPLIARLRW